MSCNDHMAARKLLGLGPDVADAEVVAATIQWWVDNGSKIKVSFAEFKRAMEEGVESFADSVEGWLRVLGEVGLAGAAAGRKAREVVQRKDSTDAP